MKDSENKEPEYFQLLDIFRDNMLMLRLDTGSPADEYRSGILSIDHRTIAEQILGEFDLPLIKQLLATPIAIEDIASPTQLKLHTVQLSEGLVAERYFLEHVIIPDLLSEGEESVDTDP